jgi:hypothetical protein
MKACQFFQKHEGRAAKRRKFMLFPDAPRSLEWSLTDQAEPDVVLCLVAAGIALADHGQ